MLNFLPIDDFNNNHKFSTFNKNKNLTTGNDLQFFPLFLIACFFYFYYYII
jgi:hypothetical protein